MDQLQKFIEDYQRTGSLDITDEELAALPPDLLLKMTGPDENGENAFRAFVEEVIQQVRSKYIVR